LVPVSRVCAGATKEPAMQKITEKMKKFRVGSCISHTPLFVGW
jgi:hypothetical protein